MAEKAHITSVEAIEAFRAQLVVYLEKAGNALDDISDDVVRMRLWLQTEQRQHWEGEYKRRLKKFEEAQQALFSAKLSSLKRAGDFDQMRFNKAKRHLQEAEEKRVMVRRWDRNFDTQVAPYAKQVDKLRNMLATDLRQAVDYLTQTVRTLDDYSRGSAPSIEGPPAGEETGGAGSDEERPAKTDSAGGEEGAK